MSRDSTTGDRAGGTEREQLLDLEGQLLEARQQLTDLRNNTRTLARAHKACNYTVCLQNCPQEEALARTYLSNDMDKGSAMELLKRNGRLQSRRQQGVRVQESHKSPCGGRDGILPEQMQNSTDGLLLAVDKFLSTPESQHPPPWGRTTL